MVAGTLHAIGDEDWYRYDGTEGLGTAAPSVDVASATGPIRVCMYFECAATDMVDFQCPPGTDHSLSPFQRPGCCGQSSFAPQGFDCVGTIVDDATVFIRVDRTDGCAGYSVAYEY